MPVRARVPVALDPVQDIPLDLDVVVRIDHTRMRALLPETLVVFLLETFEDGFGLTKVHEALTQSERVWFGFRPIAGDPGQEKPIYADYVLVATGHFEAQAAVQKDRGFYPPRDLGGGFFRHDAIDGGDRSQIGRIYEKVGERLIVASAAEVDAAERVIEGGHRVRSLVPPEQGVVSFCVDLTRVSSVVRERSPRVGRLLEQAAAAQGYFDLKTDFLALSFRMRFLSGSDADRAGRALSLVMTALGGGESSALNFAYQAVESELAVQMKADLRTVLLWLGLA